MLAKKKHSVTAYYIDSYHFKHFFKRRNRLSLNEGLILLLTFKVLYSKAPDYLRRLVHMYLWPLVGNNLRCNHDPGVLLISPTARTKKTFGAWIV